LDRRLLFLFGDLFPGAFVSRFGRPLFARLLLGLLLRLLRWRNPGHLLALRLGRNAGAEHLPTVRLDQLWRVASRRRPVGGFALASVGLSVEIRKRHLIRNGLLLAVLDQIDELEIEGLALVRRHRRQFHRRRVGNRP